MTDADLAALDEVAKLKPTHERLTRTDVAALESALVKVREQGLDRSEQIDLMLRDEPRIDVCLFASYSAQMVALHLEPHEMPPSCLNVDDPDDLLYHAQGLRLLKRMLRCGVSRYHPDPLKACRAAEGRGRFRSLRESERGD